MLDISLILNILLAIWINEILGFIGDLIKRKLS